MACRFPLFGLLSLAACAWPGELPLAKHFNGATVQEAKHDNNGMPVYAFKMREAWNQDDELAEEGSPKPAEPEIDPDVLRKVRKLIQGTLKVDEADREKAWAGLRDMGNLAVPGLLALYRQDATTPEMVKSILIALSDSKDARAGPALVAILGSKDAGVRAHAARAIGATAFKAGLPALEERLKDAGEEERVRLFAAIAAAQLGSQAGVDALKELLKSKDAVTRGRAAIGLGRHAGSKALDDVEALLKDPERGVREDAVEALRRIGEPALGQLVAAAQDEDYKVRGAAMDTLRELTGESIGNEPQKWQAWWDKKTGKAPENGEKKDGNGAREEKVTEEADEKVED